MFKRPLNYLQNLHDYVIKITCKLNFFECLKGDKQTERKIINVSIENLLKLYSWSPHAARGGYWMISIYMYSCADHLDPGLDPLHPREYPDWFKFPFKKLSNIPIPGKYNYPPPPFEP